VQNSIIYDCTLVEFPINHKLNGNITAINNFIEVPFDIKRVYYLYDIPSGAERGSHAHKDLKQLIVSLSGSFDVSVDDGNLKRTFNLNKPNVGLLLPSGLWRNLHNFSSGAICLVLASMEYMESDYIRDYEAFLNFKKNLMQR
jgi:hypothetical protein